MGLPRRAYWFSNAALSGAGVVFIGLFLSLIQVRPMIPDWALWMLIAGGVAATLVVWRTGAQQAQDAAIDQKNSAAILENLSSLVTARQERDDPVDWGKLSGLSNAQLRAAALSLASQIRVFEASHREREDLQRFEEWHSLPLPEEGHMEEFAKARQAADRVRREREDATEAAHRKAFTTQYLPKAIGIRDELLARQGIVAPVNSRSPYFSVVFDRPGMMAGVGPVGEAATSIERLARSLP